MRSSLKRSIHLTLAVLFTIGLNSCSSSTQFEDKNRETVSPKVEKVKREIASESPLSMGCHQIIEEILYIKEQRDAKKRLLKENEKLKKKSSQ